METNAIYITYYIWQFGLQGAYIFQNYFPLLLLITMIHLLQLQEGWQQQQIQTSKHITQIPQTARPYSKQDGRELLGMHRHSLQPDMIFGWRPKLPCCPLPLSYPNPYTDALLSYLPKDDRFKIIYLGPRPSNSVQLNQQFQYNWRYRSRYNANISVIKQAVKRVGNNGQRYKLDARSNQIEFDSSFQSGNLDIAVRVKKNEFDLFLRSDTNTQGHTSWFYFKVNNKDLTGQVQFNICNFGKTKNLYSKGLKPYQLTEGTDWKQQKCYEVHWVERICRYGFNKKAFQLQFKYFFQTKNQTVYFAYSIPYTYTQLQAFIRQSNLRQNKFVEYSKLCQTLGGLQVPLIKITEKIQSKQQTNLQDCKDITKKKIVLITGRIHPGEPHSSFVVQGLIKHLISDEANSQALRKSYIFYVVPMLNPDGVVAGNYRTSFSGKDLNRQFDKLNKEIYPQITALTELAKDIKRKNCSAFQFYFDIHAHSSKKGAFCCGPQHLQGKGQFLKCRAFAKCLAKKSSLFIYDNSLFTIDEKKKNTGRAYMLWGIKAPYSFTLQISNGLFETTNSKINPLNRQRLLQFGKNIIEGLQLYTQMQIKMPKYSIKAKVNTGIKAPRMHSQPSPKQFRRCSGSINIRRNSLATKQMLYTRRTNFKTQETINRTQVSLKIITAQESFVTKCNYKDQFSNILRQIQQQQKSYKTIDYYEGGSDSQAEGQDLQKEQLQRLHNFIQTRNEDQNSYLKGFNWKTNHQKQIVKIQQTKQNYQQNGKNQNSLMAKSKYLQQVRIGTIGRSKKLQIEETKKIMLQTKQIEFRL